MSLIGRFFLGHGGGGGGGFLQINFEAETRAREDEFVFTDNFNHVLL